MKRTDTNSFITLASRFIQTIAARFNIELDYNQSETLAQAIGFGLIGVSNTLVSYIVFVISYNLLERFQLFPSYNYYCAQFASYVLSVLWSYYWNSRYVFENNGIRQLIKTYISYSVTGVFLSSILLYVWIEIFGISPYLAPLLNLIITVPLNFILNKFWAFS